MTNDRPVALSAEEFKSLREVGEGDAQDEIPQSHWERLVEVGYAVRRLGEPGLTASGVHHLAAGQYSGLLRVLISYTSIAPLST
jgi:hypothetical protein